ncbi:MAG: methyl-accepting chemotaxis protein [Gloeocapsa sp. UFS-A4-WI-NPMV-4B04]|jgi:twitching motility protein PilJ|nr:methyl-accepting chemotaxis protein [Gloeocapsa sp. UFS-A4-WI-NPMV-4B04]
MISSPQPNETTTNTNFLDQNQHEAKPQGHPQRQPQMKTRSRGLSLKNKATALAIALGTLPVMAIGATSYHFADQSITKYITQQEQQTATELAVKVNRFMFERYGDIQVVANLPTLRNPKVRAVTTTVEKEAVLNQFAKIYGLYNSVVMYDLKGNILLQSQAQGKISTNVSNEDYFQAVVKTNRPFIGSPSVSPATGKVVIYSAAPVVDTATGQTIAVVRSQMPVEAIDAVVSQYASGENEYHLLDASGNIFAAKEKPQVGRNAQNDFAGLDKLLAAKKADTLVTVDKIDNAKQLVAYAPLEQLAGLPNLNWSAVLAIDTEVAFAPQRQLLLTLLLGTGLTALLVSVIAAYLAERATRPILGAANAVKKLGQGELNTRIAVKGDDEFAVLGSNVNRLGEQIQTLLVEQEEANRQQLATQEEAARQQAENAQQQKLAKENLQKRALELLIEVDPLSRGDLTIRASVTDDEIGTVADSYNSTISSLRKIVTQVQAAAQQMTTTTTSSGVSVQELSTEALRQTEEIATALDRLQEMSSSIRAVAMNAELAEVAVRQATETVEAGDATMNRTVDGIMAIQETVTEASDKVKHLGESSQKISKVVNLIGRFAAQTNLLALKASIEAARAGEEGRGFAVLADEVRTLANQSAQATTEIESLVTDIQTETKEVVAAMETGTLQVAEGSRLVNETRQSLNQITVVSAQISELVQAITESAVAQFEASEEVTESMNGVAAIANQTSTEATQVSASFKELLVVAQELQASAGQFKVN